MKKILLILILLFISVNVFAQKIQFADTSGGKTVLREVSWRYPLPVRILNFSNLLDTTKIPYLSKDNVFTGTNIFPKAYIDSLVIRIYALDTGTNITRNILPQTTRLYNFGGSSNYWLNTYTQNAYIDTVKTDIVFSRDALFDSTLTVKGNLSTNYISPITPNIIFYPKNATTKYEWRKYSDNSVTLKIANETGKLTSIAVETDTIYIGSTIGLYKSTVGTAFNNSIYFPNPARQIDWGSGNVMMGAASSYNYIIANWDGSTTDTTMYITGADSSIKIYGDLIPSNTNLQSLGSSGNRFTTVWSQRLGLVSGYGISWSNGNETITGTGAPNYSTMFANYDGSTTDTVLILNGVDSSVTVFGDLKPSNTRLQNLGTSSNYWLNTYTQNAYIDTVKTDIVFIRDVIIDSTLTIKGAVFNQGNYVYVVGDATTDGSWRFYATLSGDLIYEYRVSGSWSEKSRITK